MTAGNGKVAVITGGSRGIGRATAIAAARQGWRVLVGYAANAAAAEETLAAIRAGGGEAEAVRCDIGSEADILGLFERADAFGTIGALVNNAGITDLSMRLEEMSAERLHRIFSVNAIGTFLCSREAVRRMSTDRGGAGGVIVNISSIVARTGAANTYIDYAATKGAVDTLTIGLGQEVAAQGIRVVGVRPGLIDTEIHAVGGDPDRHHKLGPSVPMRRVGNAAEVAEAVIWMMSDAASYVAASTLDVAGGR